MVYTERSQKTWYNLRQESFEFMVTNPTNIGDVSYGRLENIRLVYVIQSNNQVGREAGKKLFEV